MRDLTNEFPGHRHKEASSAVIGLILTSNSGSSLASPMDAEVCRRSCNRMRGNPWSSLMSRSKCRDTYVGSIATPCGVVKTRSATNYPAMCSEALHSLLAAVYVNESGGRSVDGHGR
jgi:hypothetical protein